MCLLFWSSECGIGIELSVDDGVCLAAEPAGGGCHGCVNVHLSHVGAAGDRRELFDAVEAKNRQGPGDSAL